jgi:ribosomal protein S18 acetylase RimI-like enzyme
VPILEDAWLSERFGRPAFTLRADAAPEALASELAEHSSSQERAFYQSKIPTLSVDRVRALCAAGMYPAEVNVTMHASAGAVAAQESPEASFSIEVAGEEHADQVLAVAESSFRFSRFHLDPQVPRAVADDVKRAWAQSYLEGKRGEELIVAVDGDRVLGFLAALGDGEARVIDLIAVTAEAQGRGVGPALSRRFARDANESYDMLRVGTQAANTIATRMYEQLGFTVDRTLYTLHMHVGSYD